MGLCTFLWCQNQQTDFRWEKVSPSGWSAGLLWRYWIRKAAISQHLLVSLKSAVIPFTKRFKLGLGQWLPEGVQAYWKGKKWPVRDDQIIQRASVKRQCMIIWKAARKAWNRFVLKIILWFAYGMIWCFRSASEIWILLIADHDYQSCIECCLIFVHMRNQLRSSIYCEKLK